MSDTLPDYEKLGAFYLGRPYDVERGEALAEPLLYDSRDLLTHALCVGMTGSGKTGLCISLLEEAAIDRIPAIVIDPKGDLGNLLLTFPDLRPEDFQPWVAADEAARRGVTVEQLAAQEATAWRDGLARWGQGPERLARLKAAAEVALYTPGSEAGLPVSILSSLGAPPAETLADPDLLRERVSTVVASLLGLIGVDADPIKSREHVLLSTIFDAAWREGRSLDLAELIHAIQKPPFERVGVMDLESFYPARERFGLATAFNAVLAAPGQAGWLAGEPLDLDRLLYTASGTPRIAVFSLGHLGDAERMSFVALLLNQTLGWMRSRPGTASLRALVYMDEIFGYFPPVAEPPSKKPLLSLLKQARAFGVGVVLATQNPADLDYKGLANIGTWFVGRLQAERDKERLLDGLEGMAAGAAGFDRKRIGDLLSSLPKRVFYLHDVHEDAPAVFQTRWAMSYLRGPLTRAEIKRLMDPVKAGPAVAGGRRRARAADDDGSGGRAAPAARARRRRSCRRTCRRPSCRCAAGRTGRSTARPSSGIATRPLRRRQARRRACARRSRCWRRSATRGGVDWYAAEAVEVAYEDLEREPAAGARFAGLPDAAARAKSYAGWQKELAECLYRSRRCELFASPSLGELSRPGESERDFRIRLTEAARERRDAEVEKLRARHGPKVARLEERLRRAEQAREREETQASREKWQSTMAIGSSVLGALFGRKKLSATNLRRVSSAGRSVGRIFKEGEDVGRAEENVEAVKSEIAELQAQLEAEVAALQERFDPQAEPLETVALKPKKTDVEVKLVTLAWAPYGAGGEPAWG